MSGVKVPEKSGFDSFIEAQRDNDISDIDLVHPPKSLFQCCRMEICDIASKTITLVFVEWPVMLMGDGCAVNNSASTALTNMYGLLSPAARCSSHSADGSIKRMSKSETYSVEEVKTFVEHFQPILRHYQLSGRSTCL